MCAHRYMAAYQGRNPSVPAMTAQHQAYTQYIAQQAHIKKHQALEKVKMEQQLALQQQQKASELARQNALLALRVAEQQQQKQQEMVKQVAEEKQRIETEIKEAETARLERAQLFGKAQSIQSHALTIASSDT